MDEFFNYKVSKGVFHYKIQRWKGLAGFGLKSVTRLQKIFKTQKDIIISIILNINCLGRGGHISFMFNRATTHPLNFNSVKMQTRGIGLLY